MSWLQVAIDWVGELWPFQQVDQWERGVMFFLGRVVDAGWLSWIADLLHLPFRDGSGHLLPGLYAFVPWFMDIATVDVVPVPIGTPLLNITLTDTKTLSWSATYIVRVFHPKNALCEVDDYQESTGEIITSRISEKLAEVDATRIDPEKRKRLLADLLRWVNDDTREFGVEVRAIRFTNFAIDQKAYRLLTDTALGEIAW